MRAAIAGGGLSALEAALAAAPREVREGGVGVEARARRDRLLEATDEVQAAARAALRGTPRAEMPVASEYKQLLSVSGSPQITTILLLIL